MSTVNTPTAPAANQASQANQANEVKPTLRPVDPPYEPQLNAEQLQKRETVLQMINKVGGKSTSARIPLDEIYVDRSNNIRQDASYTDEDIQVLMEQIKTAGGLLQPLVVIPNQPKAENGGRKLALIIGFRRSIALKRLEGEGFDVSAIPVLIVEGLRNNAAIRMLQMLENVGRKDLTAMEKAITIRQILDDPNANFTQSQVGNMLGMTPATVTKLLSFLQFPEEIQEAINDGRLGFHNADRMRRDIPESHWAATLDIAINKPSKDFDKYCDEIRSQYDPARRTTDEEGEEGAEASDDKDTQRAPTMLRSRQVENVFIPYLKEQATKVDATEKKYTEADILKARVDTLETVLLKGDTGLAKLMAPHLAEVKAKEEAEEKQAEATKKEETFYKGLVKKAEELHKQVNKPDPSKADKPQTPLAAVYVSVINDAIAEYHDAEKDSDEVKGQKAVKREALGFALPTDRAVFGQKLREHHVAIDKARKEAAEKRAKAQKEKEDKEAAEQAAAADAARAHDPNAANVGTAGTTQSAGTSAETSKA